MFLGYYKAINNSEDGVDIVCVLGRTGLQIDNKPVGIINQTLVTTVENPFDEEANRVLLMSNDQDIFTLTNPIDSDIRVVYRSTLNQIKQYKESNPNDKVSLLTNIKRYGPDFMFYLDWESRWASIQEVDPTLIGLYYIEYKIKTGSSVELIQGSFETTIQ